MVRLVFTCCGVKLKRPATELVTTPLNEVWKRVELIVLLLKSTICTATGVPSNIVMLTREIGRAHV